MKKLLGTLCFSILLTGLCFNTQAKANTETDISAEAAAYFSNWEEISADELPEGLIPLEFDSEENAYNYFEENGELSFGEDEYYIDDARVSKEVFEAWEKDIEDGYSNEAYWDEVLSSEDSYWNDGDITPVVSKKASKTKHLGRDAGYVKLWIDYEVEREGRKNIITSADAYVTEHDIASNYNVHVESVEATIADNKKTAYAKSKIKVEKAITINDHLRIVSMNITLSGSVKA